MPRKFWTLTLILVLPILLTVLALPAGAAAKAAEENGSEGDTANYIKHVVVIAVDDLEARFFNPGQLPRLVGISKEGIQSKALDKGLTPGAAAQDGAVIGELPKLYKTGQRTSLLVDGRGAGPQLNRGFNYIITATPEQRKNPKLTMDAAIAQFSENQPFLTYLAFSCPTNDEQGKGVFFRQVDEAVGRLMAFLHERGVYDNTLVLIVGRRSPELTKRMVDEKQNGPVSFPLGIRGPNLLAGMEIPAVNLEDLPETIYYLTDGKQTGKAGNVLWNALKTDNSYVAQSLLRHRIADISDERDKLLTQQFKWEREKISFVQERTQLAGERQGIQGLLASRDQIITSLRRRITFYHVLGLLMFFTLIAGYGVQYVLLRKRFLLF